jgi:hypothetical protein
MPTTIYADARTGVNRMSDKSDVRRGIAAPASGNRFRVTKNRFCLTKEIDACGAPLLARGGRAFKSLSAGIGLNRIDVNNPFSPCKISRSGVADTCFRLVSWEE